MWNYFINFKAIYTTTDFENTFLYFFHPELPIFNLESSPTSHNEYITHFKTTTKLCQWWHDSSNSKENRKGRVGVGVYVHPVCWVSFRPQEGGESRLVFKRKEHKWDRRFTQGQEIHINPTTQVTIHPKFISLLF